MSSSKLQDLASRLAHKYFEAQGVHDNHRPDWMISKSGKRLELDVYIEGLECAIEIQGEQHYRFVKFFHGDEKGFSERLKDDRDKKSLCRKRNVILYEASNQDELFAILKELKEKAKKEVYLEGGSQEQKFIKILKREGETEKSKIHGMAYYMYYHFLEYGNFYNERNMIFHDFYTTHKAEVDKKLNELLKHERTERRLKNFSKVRI